ncbi:PsbP-related protein [Methanobrevibacter sp.]|uniref:PsbP-related protein n=1 Tax=Methanobrevibacter sp. TaxID=66852 RepID=UPI00388E838D
MKKCPECGNPSYDGAPVCGNCGFVFPKQKVAAPKKESIFENAPEKEKKPSSDESTIDIIKDNKLVIGAILLITLIVICGIVLTGSNNNKVSSPIQSADTNEFSEGGFSFNYPNDWKITNGSDENHEGAKFFENGNGTLIEFYNTTMESSSLKEITKERIGSTIESGSYVELVETISLNGKEASNVILENVDGNYTRFVSMLSDGNLYVFKMDGNSINSVTSSDITSVINSAKIA